MAFRRSGVRIPSAPPFFLAASPPQVIWVRHFVRGFSPVLHVLWRLQVIDVKVTIKKIVARLTAFIVPGAFRTVNVSRWPPVPIALQHFVRCTPRDPAALERYRVGCAECRCS